jgi:hypothetical protein
MLDRARCPILDGIEASLNVGRPNPGELHRPEPRDQVEADERLISPPGLRFNLGPMMLQPTRRVPPEYQTLGVGEKPTVEPVLELSEAVRRGVLRREPAPVFLLSFPTLFASDIDHVMPFRPSLAYRSGHLTRRLSADY